MRNTDFAKFIQCIEPLKEEQENIENFVNRVFVEYTPYREGVPEINIKRAPATLRKYAYGTSEISKSLANDLLKAPHEETFAKFLKDTNEEIKNLMLNNFIDLFQMKNISKANMHMKIAKLFTSILREASTRTKKKSTPVPNANDFIKKPYIEDGMLIIGNSKLLLPSAEIPSKEIPDSELQLKYLYALVDAYNDAEHSSITLPDLKKFKKKYKDNFYEQRVNFYEADCLKNFSRDTLKSDDNEFQKLLDDTYDGVINTSRKNYDNGYNRLLSVLEQAVNINLDASQLYHIPGIINNKRKIGFCHMLVNDDRISWIDEEEEDDDE